MDYTKIHHSAPYASLAPTRPELSMRGKSVLITGGGAGIGRQAALAFAAAGAQTITLIGRRPEPLAATALDIRSAHPDSAVLTFAVDVLDAAALGTAVAAAAARQPLDIVVHCAGALGAVGPLATADVSGLWAGFEANVRGTLTVMQVVLPHFAAAAVFVPLVSAAVVLPPMPGMAAYTASKAAVVKLAECFAAENPHVRVVSVHPGLVHTDMASELESHGIKFPYDDPSLSGSFLVWLASDEAAFLKNKFVFANWDIDELKQRKDEINGSRELTIGLHGFPRAS